MINLPAWLTHDATSCQLALHIQPGAKQSRVIGEHGAALKIAIKAPAVDGKANEALIQFLSDRLKCPRAHITLIRGEHARQKVVRINDCAANWLTSQLTPVDNKH